MKNLRNNPLLDETLVIIMAGGQGQRLYPLTKDRAKPGVPFGGIYRIIDFTLSNCLNSGLRHINILTQYKSFSLDRHIRDAWLFLNRPELGEELNLIPPQLRVNSNWYQGTADAIYQNIYLLESVKPARVLCLSGDHIYKMNYAEMLRKHVETGADLTIGGIRIDKSEASEFGIMVVDEAGKIVGFQEKPKTNPQTIPGHPGKCLASMGIYVFNTDVLVRELTKDARREDSSHDFGKNIIPGMLERKKLTSHMMESFGEAGNDEPYWRDVGTLDAYYEAHMDMTGENPPLDLFSQVWPIRTFRDQLPPAQIVGDGKDGPCKISHALVPSGCVLRQCHVERSTLSPKVFIGPGSHVSEAVLMEDCRIGKHCKIRRCIVDKHVVLADKTVIGYDLEDDRRRFQISDKGIVIVPKGYRNDVGGAELPKKSASARTKAVQGGEA
ncbi:MAG TPA: glucose-1-phosphate adenylyltransferase [Planctomycetota bacterium]|nr:glucose-1-phosphate adenylyltransferase [Planctomycetota bacterium]